MHIIMKMLYLYPMENCCISLPFLAACRLTLSPFSQTRSDQHISQVPLS